VGGGARGGGGGGGGWARFSEEDSVRPTVTRGIVTRVSDPVAMLQTTCCVQSGASGGALFRSTGDLVGLISCNIMDTCTGALFPRINMAVPTSVLAEPLNDYLRTGGEQVYVCVCVSRSFYKTKSINVYSQQF
jgi:S1-C subfamily serine protease